MNNIQMVCAVLAVMLTCLWTVHGVVFYLAVKRGQKASWDCLVLFPIALLTIIALWR